MIRRTSRRRTSRRTQCFKKNPKIVGFGMVPNGASKALTRTFAKCLRWAQGTYADLGPVGFKTSPAAGDAGRHYAYCEQHPDDSLTIVFAPDVVALTHKHLLGLMFHELGHAIDFRYPAGELTRRIGGGIPRERERRADEIARRTFGHVIEYDPDIGNVQCVACNGVFPRPRGLQ
jgi:hypothetical protein